MWSEEYKDCLDYIDSYWNKITFKPSPLKLRQKVIRLPELLIRKNKPSVHFVNIPYHYFVPNDNKFKFVFYWDSFFMFQGLIGTKRQWLMKKQVNNFLYIFEKYKIIPNFNSPASMGRSQPPFLTSMILETYKAETNPLLSQRIYKKVLSPIKKQRMKKWLKKAMEVAKEEYTTVWLDPEGSYHHSVEGYELARYGDRDIGYAHSSELESGWDMTSRFFNRCDQFFPVDLNTYLYKYECDFAEVASFFGEKKEEAFWRKQAEKRKELIQSHMWDKKSGFFFDYGFIYKRISSFYSLAGFTPLWAGLATQEQAEQMVKNLPKFETEYGLTITAKESLARPIDLSKIQKRYHPAIEEIIQPKQWDYPNIWSPLEYLTVAGLLKYGFVEDAKRIMEKSVKAHAALFRKYGTFFEKINAETGEPSASFHYAGQKGFGWTNAAFFRYIQLLDSLN